MTAAKVMDVSARQPDCDGQAADAVPAYTQVKIGGCSKIAQNSRVRMSIKGYLFHDIYGPNLCQTLKIQWLILNEMCTDTRLQDSSGEDSSSKSCWKLDPKRYRVGNVCLFIKNKDCS